MTQGGGVPAGGHLQRSVLLREHERLQRKLADAQRKGKAKATGVFDAAGKRMIWRSYELHQKTYCDPVQLYYLKDDPLEQVEMAE